MITVVDYFSITPYEYCIILVEDGISYCLSTHDIQPKTIIDALEAEKDRRAAQRIANKRLEQQIHAYLQETTAWQ
jgi:hypothetical protein